MKRITKLAILLIGIILLSSCTHDDAPKLYTTDPLEPQDTTAITFPNGSTVQKIGENYVWLGDILLSPKQLEEIKNTGFITDITKPGDEGGPNLNLAPVTNMLLNSPSNVNPSAAVGIYPGINANTWAMVRYVYAPDLTWDRKQIIREAIAHWEANTNVRFYNATSQPTRDPKYRFNYPYIEFVNGKGNNSYIGLIGGRQVINLAQYQIPRVAIHEIGHAIGLFHEQSAFNRDNFININLSNVKPEARNNFDRVRTNYYTIGSVDFNSIMMYSSFISDPAMVYNSNIPAMTRKDGSTWSTTDELSVTDKMWANRFYLPYIARSDVYRELAAIVYKPDNTIMTPTERIQLQARINNGNPTPPSGGRIPNNH